MVPHLFDAEIQLPAKQLATFRQLGPHWQPEPMRAHGAWIYLFASVGAGALVGADHRADFGIERAMLAGTGFVGAYLVVAAIVSGLQKKMRQMLVGASLMLFAPLGALGLGAHPAFLGVAAGAVFPAISVVVLAKQLGPLARTTLVVGVGTITMSAPLTALAGQARGGQCVLLFGFLGAFFCWRTLRVADSLKVQAAWDRQSLRSRGLREAAIAAVWAFVVAMSLRMHGSGSHWLLS